MSAEKLLKLISDEDAEYVAEADTIGDSDIEEKPAEAEDTTSDKVEGEEGHENAEKPQKNEALGRLVIFNTPFDYTNEALEKLFSPFGEIVKCYARKGFSFVDFKAKEDAEKAIEGLKDTILNGKKEIQIEWADVRREVSFGERTL